MERKVVVTGLGAVTPVGNDAFASFEAAVAGKCGIDGITRFDTTQFKARLAGEVKDFDPTLYMPKGEVRKHDLFSQYAIASAVQAVEDSGIAGSIEPEKFGVYFGSGIGGISTLMNEHNKLLGGGPKKVSPFFVPMMIINMAAGAIAMRFSAKGPSLPVVTACATSTNSIGEAYRAIKNGYADAVIAGGSEAAINPLAVGGFISCMALSCAEDKNAASLPFDKRRAGFVMGEGAGALILEEEGRARARGAKIYAYISGYGNTNDAYHMTAPDPEAEASSRAIKLAADEAGITDLSSVYVNAHGTATPLNDRTETLALKKAFGQDAYKLKVSSTKSVTGHMLGAAGAVEAIFSVLALKKGFIPPTANYSQPDPECDLDVTPGKAANVQKRYALSTSLGFGGHNACIAFEKAD